LCDDGVVMDTILTRNSIVHYLLEKFCVTIGSILHRQPTFVVSFYNLYGEPPIATYPENAGLSLVALVGVLIGDSSPLLAPNLLRVTDTMLLGRSLATRIYKSGAVWQRLTR
jgi:hypothetical protein